MKNKVGICGIHITVGKKEEKAFMEAQDYLKATKQASGFKNRLLRILILSVGFRSIFICMSNGVTGILLDSSSKR